MGYPILFLICDLCEAMEVIQYEIQEPVTSEALKLSRVKSDLKIGFLRVELGGIHLSWSKKQPP